MTKTFLLGFLITLGAFIYLSLSTGLKAAKGGSSKKDGSAAVVSGAIIGTLVGGSSTIGTAQLAYSYGMSAWWFTLGAGIGCLLLAISFAEPFRKKCKVTITGMVREHYGERVGLTTTVFTTVGMYINIIAQLISAASIVLMIFADMSLVGGILISAVLMILYALSGGVSGVGKIGVFKTVLLYITTIGGGLAAVSLFGGLDEIFTNPVLVEGNYFSLFNRGFGKDLGCGLSVILGVISTQTYIQALLAGNSDASAKKGALVSACMIPPIGIGGILIGMYMRVSCPDLTSTKFALPQFIMDHMHPAVAGVIFATLLITVLGTGAGLALGIGTNVKRDLILNERIGLSDRVKSLVTERKLIIVTLLSAVILASGDLGDFILDYSFMSMGLRAATVFIPIIFILFVKKPVPVKYAGLAVIAGPAAVLIGNLISVPFDPLFLGVFANLAVMAAGYIKGESK